MATSNPVTVIDHSSDAGARAWIAEFITMLGVGGALSQLADGAGAGHGGTQVNTSTYTRPGTSTNGGHSVHQYTDSLQATAPYFFRFDYGTGTLANIPRIQLTVGASCTGGVIGGVLLAATTINRAQVPTNIATPVNSWVCGHPGVINIAWKIGGSDIGCSLFSAYRIRNHSGVQTDEGLSLVITNDSTVTAFKRCFRRASAATFGPSKAASFVAMEVTSSVTAGGDRQLFRHFSALPEARPDLELVSVIAAEAGIAGTVFPARPTGGVDRNYVVLGTLIRGGLIAGNADSATSHSICMLYD